MGTVKRVSGNLLLAFLAFALPYMLIEGFYRIKNRKMIELRESLETTKRLRVHEIGRIHKRLDADGASRFTSEQPKSFSHTIYVFGGSTVYGCSNDDRHTIPSFLQRLTAGYRVQNYGVNGNSIREQLALMKTVLIKTGDIVVFYDGINDVMMAEFSVPDKWFIKEISERKSSLVHSFTKTERVMDWIHDNVGPSSEFLNDVSDVRAKALHNRESNGDVVARNFTRELDLFEKCMREAQQYAQQHGARFFHFLQPVIGTGDLTTEYEAAMVSCKQTEWYTQAHLNAWYPKFQEVSQKVSGERSFDLRKVLDSRKPGQEFFVDCCHVNYEGNEIVAKAIFEKMNLTPRSPQNSQPFDRSLANRSSQSIR